jgi:calcium/calmodulin-dependent protein kinase I
MSILENVCSQASSETFFWKKHNPLTGRLISKPVIFKGQLIFAYPETDLYLFEVFLTSSRLYFNSNSSDIMMAKIKWSLIETFYIKDSENIKFGFVLRTNYKAYEFFTLNLIELNNWVEALSQVCIMTNFEENYVIIKKIDQSDYATVFLVHDLATRSEFVAKRIKKKAIEKSSSLFQLFNEIHLHRKLGHISIVKLLRLFENSKYLYLVMEYVRFGTLNDRLKTSCKFSEREVAIFGRKIFEVLAYLHAKGIIHRDIKPENILMCTKNSVTEFKIADFGLACYITEERQGMPGSAGYMAPEILRGNYYSNKVDIYSAGVVLYVMLTGKYPFNSRDLHDTVRKNTVGEISFNQRVFSKLSPCGVEILKEILVSEPYLRPIACDIVNCTWMRKFTENSMDEKINVSGYSDVKRLQRNSTVSSKHTDGMLTSFNT